MGDFVSDKGPAIVNKHYRNYIKNECFICTTNNKFIRIVHFMICLPWIKTLLISGLSGFHLKAAKLARFCKKKTVYLMHGYKKIEYKINYGISEKNRDLEMEDYMLETVDKIICVSEKFSQYLKKDRKKLAFKIDFVNNGIEARKKVLKESKEYYTIMSVGGGVKLKNNLAICQAIEKLKNHKVKYIVIGEKAQQGEKIMTYNFVEYYERLHHDDVLKMMQSVDLYIQNSCFETFGLAAAEAIEQGSNILLSENMGVLSTFECIDSSSIIYDNNNVEEIEEKIKNNIEDSGKIHVELKKNTTWKAEADILRKKLIGEVDEKTK